MATDQAPSESSTPQKRQRRAKHDPQFVFTTTTSVVSSPEPLSPVVKKLKAKSSVRAEDSLTGADLYEPGDIVWSKLGSFPWWPALIYQCDAEGGDHSRTLNSNGKSKRQFFVYYYGKYLEYAWLFPRSLLKYEGLERFIASAETAVQQAATKSEQVELANRFQLKVSMKKRPQWDEAIALADQALTMTKAERIQEFKDLLDAAQKKKRPQSGTRRRKISADRETEQVIASKRPARISSASSSSFELPDEKAKSELEQSETKKRRQKSNGNRRNTTTNPIQALSHGSTTTDNQPMSAAIHHRIQAHLPPLSNYELKQIAEGLLQQSNASTLTFDEAERFAVDKAIEIVNENYQYRMNTVSTEWFYDAILLRHPTIVFKYQSWFEGAQPETMPNEANVLELKRWQIALMIRAHKQSEQQQTPSSNDP